VKSLFLLCVLCAVTVLGCSGESLTEGLTEPLRVRYGGTRNAQFHGGQLPGSKPLSSEETLTGVKPNLPSTTLTTARGVVVQADTEFVLSGVTSTEAVAIGIRFEDLGTGYWVLPVTSRDPALPGTFSWSATADFGVGIPPGRHTLRVVAIDGAGHAGTQTETSLCVTSAVPDNLSACSPGATPPSTVLSMVWDTPVDLDLRVITPQGKIVDPKHPSTSVAVDGQVDVTQKGTGIFDRDAVRGCVHDGHQRENLVWQDAPLPGTYFVYASLYDACGQAAVRFQVSINRPGPELDGGTQPLINTFSLTGELLAVDADSGAKLGLFVTEFLVQ
jgi:hypothetical protein